MAMTEDSRISIGNSDRSLAYFVSMELIKKYWKKIRVGPIKYFQVIIAEPQLTSLRMRPNAVQAVWLSIIIFFLQN